MRAMSPRSACGWGRGDERSVNPELRNRPLATTSTHPPSATSTSMFMSATRTLRATRAPATRHAAGRQAALAEAGAERGRACKLANNRNGFGTPTAQFASRGTHGQLACPLNIAANGSNASGLARPRNASSITTRPGDVVIRTHAVDAQRRHPGVGLRRMRNARTTAPTRVLSAYRKGAQVSRQDCCARRARR